jgi:hypothetical protein
LITPTAEQLVQDALDIMKERGATRDKPQGERAMAATVKAFNAVTGRNLSETEGWKFMMCLKLGRAAQGKFHADDYHDLIGYSALTAECAFREQTDKEIAAKLFAQPSKPQGRLGGCVRCGAKNGELHDPACLTQRPSSTCPCGRADVNFGQHCPCGQFQRPF